MDRKTRDLMYKSFDERLTEQQEQLLNEALESSEELRREHEEIRILRSQIEACDEQSFGPFFADRVMANINSQESAGEFLPSLISVFRPVAIVAAIVALVLVPYNLHKMDYVNNITQSIENIIEQANILYLEKLL